MSENLKRPEWLKVSFNKDSVDEVARLMQDLNLNTVCKEANCPNMGECFGKHTATFMIMGSNCTRNCKYCNVTCAKPVPLDPCEPKNLAEAAKKLGLKHVVITSVTRDDLKDGGAHHFAECIREIRSRMPETTIEVLIPDFKGNEADIDVVLDAEPDVLNHNIETVKELFEKVRPQADYQRSLDVLGYCKEKRPDIRLKTGFMVGLGETDEQILKLMEDVQKTGCDILTIGQYLRPSKDHAELDRYVTPEQFAEYKKQAMALGIKFVISAPLARSSYKAFEALKATTK